MSDNDFATRNLRDIKKLISEFLRILEKYITWTAPEYYLKQEFKEDKKKWEKKRKS